MSEKKEVALTVGVFPGFLDTDGKLLIQRRKEKGSNIPGKSFLGDYELPGGGLTPEELNQLRTGALIPFLVKNIPYNHLIPSEMILSAPEEVLIKAIRREALEEEGLVLNIRDTDILHDATYRAILVQRKLAKIDIAISAPVYPRGLINMPQWFGEPTGEFEWADAERIKELCQKPKGEQIVSGWGKRMCQMMLWCLKYSCNLSIRESARNYLEAIQKEKGYPYLVRETLSVIE